MEIKVSENFKKQTTKAILAILFFIISYVIIIGLTICIAIAMVLLGVFLLYKPNFITLLFFIGLVISALLIVGFLFKFIFQKKSENLDGLHEIKAHEHPKLFLMIEDIVKQVETDFPKKVYISNQLNASVFYDSSFWSMFLPIKKNLHIGLGLVNISTDEELKGILAHEFGHFSQRSMKLGSYVYNANRIIYNLLHENNTFEKWIAKVASYHYVFVITSYLAIWIIKLVQNSLRFLYKIVNKSYLSLSREMEFHADEVATNIVGSKTMISSLNRMDFADSVYNNSFGFLNKLYDDKLKVTNFFYLNRLVLKINANKEKLNFDGDLPIVTPEDAEKFSVSRVNITDQWASHPTMKNRTDAIKKLNIECKVISSASAFNLFDNVKQLQEKFTNNLYPETTDLISILEDSNLETEYNKYYDSLGFNQEYNGYYNFKNPIIETNQTVFVPEDTSLKSLFSEDVLINYGHLKSIQNDIADLKFLAFEKNDINSFDFDGTKYKKKHAKKFINELEVELETKSEFIKKHDKLIYSYFKQQANKTNTTEKFNLLYNKFLNADKLYDEGNLIVNTIIDNTSFMYVETPFEVIDKELIKLKSSEETLINHIKVLLQDVDVVNYTPEKDIDVLNKYLENRAPYYSNKVYNDDALKILQDCLYILPYVHSENIFQCKKNLLDFQIQIAK